MTSHRLLLSNQNQLVITFYLYQASSNNNEYVNHLFRHLKDLQVLLIAYFTVNLVLIVVMNDLNY
jgi:hypothetical protein